MFNFISLLGWSPVGEEEIFSQEELIKIFDADRLGKSPAAFDNKKLEWISNQYMKQLDRKTMAEMALPYLIEAGLVEENPTAEKQAWVEELVSLYQPQMSYAKEIVELSSLFFNDTLSFDESAKEVLSDEQVPEVLEAFKTQLKELEEFDVPTIKKAIKAVQKKQELKVKIIYANSCSSQWTNAWSRISRNDSFIR